MSVNEEFEKSYAEHIKKMKPARVKVSTRRIEFKAGYEAGQASGQHQGMERAAVIVENKMLITAKLINLRNDLAVAIRKELKP
jgi:flagellar biosynthesis/type III secretory pathway protein FliH